MLALLKKYSGLFSIVTLVLLFVSCQEEALLEDSQLYDDKTIELNAEELYTNWEELEEELLNQVNEYRTALGLVAMQVDPTAYEFAKSHNEYMITEDRLSHDHFSKRAQQLTQLTGGTEVAENVARNYPSPKSALEAWLQSPGHRKNIEGNYNFTGISIKSDPKGNLYFTQIFLKK